MVDLTGIVRPGDGIVSGQACAEPQTLLESLVEQRATLSGCKLFLGASYSGIVKPEHADHLRLSSYCGIGRNRVLADAGVIGILPIAYSQIAPLIRVRTIACDVVMIQVSAPNSRGEYSMGLAADYLIPAIETARAVIAEVNEQIPWTHSERLLRASDFALLAASSRPPAAPPAPRPSGLEEAIGRHAAAYVPERATLEFGIGTLPDAVCGALKSHRGLRVHSGTVGDGILSLPAESVACAMLIGSRRLFEFARENSQVRLRSSEHTHGPRALAAIERFVAINSAVEVDLTGQANSELANGSYVGAIGGAPDFMRAAGQSPGGVSIIVLPASRVVERLSGPVTVARSDAGVVVTEKGAADLRGCTLAERARRLHNISGSS
ncbi:MAG TPA: acetyl-CoA hydrolase/transferase C-terminal domain-containing protein [Burkholderiales bacterium]|nr:acetyl-CoA hydrolase/transferase C-terminal domain-containing protein [Burkholderiales bacterium]